MVYAPTPAQRVFRSRRREIRVGLSGIVEEETNPSIRRTSSHCQECPAMSKSMVGPWGPEPQASTVSTYHRCEREQHREY